MIGKYISNRYIWQGRKSLRRDTGLRCLVGGGGVPGVAGGAGDGGSGEGQTGIAFDLATVRSTARHTQRLDASGFTGRLKKPPDRPVRSQRPLLGCLTVLGNAPARLEAVKKSPVIGLGRRNRPPPHPKKTNPLFCRTS